MLAISSKSQQQLRSYVHMNSQSNSLITTLLHKLRSLLGKKLKKLKKLLPTEKTATLIDNIFVNDQTQKYNSGNITTCMSDHLPQFIIIENGKGDKPTNKTARKTYRDYKNFDMESFKVDLQALTGLLAHRTMI